jgi:glycosyltransferase involved in cell wall biosynthesis
MEPLSLSLSIILPLKSAVVKDFNEYFEKAIKSIQNNPVSIHVLIVVHTPEEQLVKFLNEFNFENIPVKKVLYSDAPSYASQINFGIKNATGEWVSFFEFDDEYSAIWFKNVKEYISYYPEVQVFLPIVVDTDDKGGFAGFTNEATFAANFSQEMGYLTNETLQTYQNFQSAGAVFKKQVLEDFGGFKPSIKLTFVYEFLLRLTYNSIKIMTIPRLGYKHLNLREGSIFWNYKYSVETLLEDEIKFWIQAAKKEHFFSEDRAIKYESQTI